MDNMRLKLILPEVQPKNYTQPKQCPYKGCPGKHFRRRQVVNKAIRDGQYEAVEAWRYQCLRCGGPFGSTRKE